MKKVFSIGRDSSCDIVLYDPSQIVSRSHATLRVDGGKYYITDHSTNGTYRNGIRLTPDIEYRITKDDDVSFGDVVTLDWTSIPGYGNRVHVWPFLLALLVIGAIVTALVWLRPEFEQAPNDTIIPPTSSTIDSTAVSTQQDSLVVLENINAKKKNQSQSKSQTKHKAKNNDKIKVAKKALDGYKDEDDTKDVDAL